jgi:hypothetical protein
MVKISYKITGLLANISGIGGLILSFIGLTFQQYFPWVKFKSDRFLLTRFREGEVFWEWIYYELSPFILHYNSETGEIMTNWFYRVNMTVTGVICAMGIVLSLMGIALSRKKVTLAGGLVIVFSMIAFATSLPGVYPNFNWGWGAKATFYGALLIMLSAALRTIYENGVRNEEYLSSLIKLWQKK